MATTMLDLDGVAYPFAPTFYEWACKRTNQELCAMDTWHFYRPWGWTDAEFVELLSQFGAEGGFGDAEPLPGATTLVSVLVAAGHTVHVVTDRPDTAHADTNWWVETYLPDYTSLTITRDKTCFIEYDDGPYFGIDDRIENVQSMRDKGIDAYLLDQPWNEKSDLPRVNSLTDYAKIVLASN